MCLLPSQTQLFDEGPVTFDVFAFQVIQEAPALTHQLDQTPPGVMVLGVDLEVVREVIDPLAQDSHLHLGGAGVHVMQPVPVDDFLFLIRS
jgi:hypothetical protein